MKTKLEDFKKSIEVWNVHLPDHQNETDRCRDLLTGEELGRAAKFINPADSNRFILSRGLLRRILADCLGAAPAELRFNRNAQGKPFLENGGLEFNVSHSRDRLLIAVTAGRAVGVDIEFRRGGLNINSIAKRWFAPEEQAFVQTLEKPEDAFFEIWAKKEAYVKALGIGIYKELNTFAVPVGETPFFPPEHSSSLRRGAQSPVGETPFFPPEHSPLIRKALAAVVGETPFFPPEHSPDDRPDFRRFVGETPFFPPEHSERGSVIAGQRPKGEAILGTGGQWFFQTLEIDSGYAAAVVSEAPAVPVNLRTF